MAPLCCAAKFDPFLSLDCAPTPSTLAQSKERKGSNFAIWQPWLQGAVARFGLGEQQRRIRKFGAETDRADLRREGAEHQRDESTRQRRRHVPAARGQQRDAAAEVVRRFLLEGWVI